MAGRNVHAVLIRFKTRLKERKRFNNRKTRTRNGNNCYNAIQIYATVEETNEVQISDLL